MVQKTISTRPAGGLDREGGASGKCRLPGPRDPRGRRGILNVDTYVTRARTDLPSAEGGDSRSFGAGMFTAGRPPARDGQVRPAGDLPIGARQ